MSPRLVLLALFWMSPALAADPPSFTLYFGLGSAAPTPEARAVIERAAEAARQRQHDGSFDHVKVIGYADTSGSDRRAQTLSDERAERVKEMLVGQGVPADRVRIEGRGKQSLAVATANHVAEQRNRRARIVIYGPGE
jgi:outer membrane protein OmpA-like peptidoglycan-associated protein